MLSAIPEADNTARRSWRCQAGIESSVQTPWPGAVGECERLSRLRHVLQARAHGHCAEETHGWWTGKDRVTEGSRHGGIRHDRAPCIQRQRRSGRDRALSCQHQDTIAAYGTRDRNAEAPKAKRAL